MDLVSHWDEMRARTPGAGNAFIHLNHASTSLPDDRTLQEQERYLQLEREMGAHRAAERIRPLLDSVPVAVARLVSAQPHQVAFQASASRGFALALSAVAPHKALEVFVSPYEWAANLMCIESTVRASLTVVRKGDREWPDAFAKALASRDRNRTAVVSLPIVSTTGAFLPQLDQVCKVVRDCGAWLFIDAGQAVGKSRINFSALGADLLFFPARKWLRGPKGVAATVFSDKALTHFGSPAAPDILGSRWLPESDGQSLQHSEGALRFQSYDQSPALQLGLLAAIGCHEVFGMHETEARVAQRSRVLHELVGAVPGIVIEPDTALGFVCFRPCSASERSVKQVERALWRSGVNAGVVTSRYAPLQLAEGDALLRLTPHAFTTDDEMESAVSRLAAVTRHYCLTD